MWSWNSCFSTFLYIWNWKFGVPTSDLIILIAWGLIPAIRLISILFLIYIFPANTLFLHCQWRVKSPQVERHGDGQGTSMVFKFGYGFGVGCFLDLKVILGLRKPRNSIVAVPSCGFHSTFKSDCLKLWKIQIYLIKVAGKVQRTFIESENLTLYYIYYSNDTQKLFRRHLGRSVARSDPLRTSDIATAFARLAICLDFPSFPNVLWPIRRRSSSAKPSLNFTCKKCCI